MAEVRRGPTREDVSPLYVQMGPRMSDALRQARGDHRLAGQMIEDFRGWAREYRDLWLAGERVPGPPHVETLGKGFARRGESA